MGKPVEVTRHEHDASGLRWLAGRVDDADMARRLLALALILDGKNRTEAAQATGMDRQTLRDWVHRYNAEGPEGLSDRKRPGTPHRLSLEQRGTLSDWVRAGPDPEKDGVVRWRRADLAARIKREFGVVMSERGVGALLHRLNFRRLSVRPRHPKQDPEALEAHKKTSRIWSVRRSPNTPAPGRSRSGGKTRPVSASKAP